MTTLELLLLVGVVSQLMVGAFFAGSWWELHRHDGWYREDYDAYDVLQADCDAWAEAQDDGPVG